MELTNDPFGEENLLLTQKKQRIKSKNSDRKCNISKKKREDAPTKVEHKQMQTKKPNISIGDIAWEKSHWLQGSKEIVEAEHCM